MIEVMEKMKGAKRKGILTDEVIKNAKDFHKNAREANLNDLIPFLKWAEYPSGIMVHVIKYVHIWIKSKTDTADELNEWMFAADRDGAERHSEEFEALKSAISHILDMAVNRIEMATGRRLDSEQNLREFLTEPNRTTEQLQEMQAQVEAAEVHEETHSLHQRRFRKERVSKRTSRIEITNMIAEFKQKQVTARDIGGQAPDNAVLHCEYCNARILKELVRCDKCGTRNQECGDPFVNEASIIEALTQECKMLIKAKLVTTGCRGTRPAHMEASLRHVAIKRQIRAQKFGYANYYDRWVDNAWDAENEV